MVASKSAPHIHHFHEPDDEFTALSRTGEIHAAAPTRSTSSGVGLYVPGHGRGSRSMTLDRAHADLVPSFVAAARRLLLPQCLIMRSGKRPGQRLQLVASGPLQ